MEKDKPRNGKRTRRTRQQILEDEAAVSGAVMPRSTSSSSNDGNANNHQKKSLRIMFQDAKSGKLGKRRRSKIKNYVWPRTVESTKSPFADQSGKNKLFYLLSINLFPESKIIQPSDTETEDEENYDPVKDNDDLTEANVRTSSATNDLLNVTDEALMPEGEMSPSLPSPKVRRGRRPTKSRRAPYGRANDQDHSWRSNYNRRCTQRRARQQGSRQRIWDPQVIDDIITAVIERYCHGQNFPQRVIEHDANNNELQL